MQRSSTGRCFQVFQSPYNNQGRGVRVRLRLQFVVQGSLPLPAPPPGSVQETGSLTIGNEPLDRTLDKIRAEFADGGLRLEWDRATCDASSTFFLSFLNLVRSKSQ